MEKLGLIALANKDLVEAEEAFLEALAHDPGNVHAALGLRRLCEVTGRKDEANDYAKLASYCWRKADPGLLEKEWDIIRASISESSVPAAMR